MANERQISVPLPIAIGAGALLVAVLGFLGLRALLSGDDKAPFTIEGAMVSPTRDNRVLPDQTTCPDGGRSDAADAPLPEAVFAPGDKAVDAVVAPGQIVAFEFLLKAAPDAPSGAIDFEVVWPKQTTEDRGFDGERGVLCTFVDGSDPSAKEVGGVKATARQAGLPPTQTEMRADVAVQGLDAGDSVVVELWVAAPTAIVDSGGALQVLLGEVSADGGREVDIVRKNVDLRLSSFDRAATANLTLDMDDSKREAEKVTYIVKVSNDSEALAPVARLDIFPDKTSATGEAVIRDGQGSPTTCSKGADGRLACTLGFLNPGESVEVEVPATISAGAQRNWTVEDGTCSGELVDICAQAVLTWSRGSGDEPKLEAAEPTDLVGGAALSIAKLVPVGPFAYPGSRVPFTYRVSNGGSAGAFSKVEVTDSKCTPVVLDSGDLNVNGKLDPSESWDFTCTSDPMTEDLARSDSRVDALNDAGAPVTETSPTQIKLITPKLAVTINPAENPRGRVITVEATGNTGLETIAVVAPLCDNLTQTGDGNGDGRLDTSERWTWGCEADPGVDVVATAYGTDDLRGAVVRRSDQDALEAATTTTR